MMSPPGTASLDILMMNLLYHWFKASPGYFRLGSLQRYYTGGKCVLFDLPIIFIHLCGVVFQMCVFLDDLEIEFWAEPP